MKCDIGHFEIEFDATLLPFMECPLCKALKEREYIEGGMACIKEQSIDILGDCIDELDVDAYEVASKSYCKELFKKAIAEIEDLDLDFY